MLPDVGACVSARRKFPNCIALLIVHGNASAADIETLGETVRQRVLETSDIDLDWEIRRIGEVAHGA